MKTLYIILIFLFASCEKQAIEETPATVDWSYNVDTYDPDVFIMGFGTGGTPIKPCPNPVDYTWHDHQNCDTSKLYITPGERRFPESACTLTVVDSSSVGIIKGIKIHRYPVTHDGSIDVTKPTQTFNLKVDNN